MGDVSLPSSSLLVLGINSLVFSIDGSWMGIELVLLLLPTKAQAQCD
jgi:hypothetical protein